MFETDMPYGYFFPDGSDNGFAVSGTGADFWYKVTDSLKRHALGWTQSSN